MTSVNLLLLILLIFLMLLCVTGKEVLFRLAEETQPDFMLGDVLLKSDLKYKFNSSIQKMLRFSFLNPTDPGVGYFRIEEIGGQIFTKQTIDRDTLCSVVQTCCPGPGGCYIKIIVGVRPREYFTIVNIRVDILDINDNRPQFPQSTAVIRISESSPVNSSFLIPTALDIDAGNNGVQNYRLISPSSPPMFALRIYRSNHEITDVALVNLRPMDREHTAVYQVKVVANDGGLPELTGTCTINIVIADANDNRPIFKNTTYTASVKESVAVNSTVIQVHADDPDDGLNGEVRYSVSHRAMDWVKDSFGVYEKSGWVYIKKPLNYEGTRMYSIPIEAKDMGSGGIPTRATVVIHILDVNDNSPTIHINLLTDSDTAEVSEIDDIGTFVAHILVQDIDSGKNSQASCAIDNPYFRLVRGDSGGSSDSEEYKLLTATKLNRETVSEYIVTIVCQDSGQPSRESRETFRVTVLDANDNIPVFSQQKYTADVEENNSKGDFLLKVSATDQDTGDAGAVHYLIENDGVHMATINHKGEIYANAIFDREQYDDDIVFKVIAYDGDPTKPLSSTATIILRIKDENDNPPKFLHTYQFNVTEGVMPHTAVGQVEATDVDLGRNAVITFGMRSSEESDAFEITRKGVITTKRRLDRERRAMYILQVTATDDGKIPLTTEAKVYIHVQDRNDNSPIIWFPNIANNTVYISYLEPQGHRITRINATDSDKGRNAKLLYFIKHGDTTGLFSIDNPTGVIKVNRKIMKTEALVYRLRIMVKDSGHEKQNSNSETLTVVVDSTGKPITIGGAYIERLPNNKNLIIVICLAAVSGILAIILIIAIICIRQKDINNHNYNVKTETQRIFNNKRTNSPNSSHDSSGDETNKPHGPKKEVSFSLETADEMSEHNNHSTFLTMKNQQSWGSSINAKSFEQPQACSSLIANTLDSEPRLTSDNYRTANNLSGQKTTKKPDKKAKGPKMKEIVDLLKHTCDTDSETSTTNHSTADSGRGGSEEDINYNTHSCDECALDLSLDSANNISNKGCRGTRCPLKVQNIPVHVDPDSSTTTSNNSSGLTDDSNIFNDSSYITPANRLTIVDASFKALNTEYASPTPSPMIDSQPSFKPPSSNGRCVAPFPGTSNSYRTARKCSAGSLAGSVGYSCVDMDTVLEETPDYSRCREMSPRDASFSNESDVIDPEQLCNEINSLFFTDTPGTSWV